ncbi:MAG TPA: hypothetical protein VE524_00485 [Nitrososphaeraceae archaeon]|jgi:hypothetical protein|nr:hypothetical protein [Nitrososphaeraceae archaeon]
MNHIQTINGNNNAIILLVIMLYSINAQQQIIPVKFLFLRVRSRTSAEAQPELIQLTSLLHNTILKIELVRELCFKV